MSQTQPQNSTHQPQTLLTGDRPTGPLHIGHYFGSLQKRVELQTHFESYIMIADVQALTDNWDDPEKVRSNVNEVLLDYLACGINPEKSTIFIQSQIPQIAELTVFYSNLVTINRLKRNPTIKTEITQKADKFGADGGGVTFGFLGYPVSQTADISFLRANIVPVGEDQLPILEQAQEILERFNRIYKTEVFPIPKAVISKGSRILGLDGKKMSKSLNNSIYLRDTEEETLKKIKKAKTDSETGITYDPVLRPEISNLLKLYSLAKNIDISEAQKDVANLNYGSFKQELAKSLNEYFYEIRAKRIELAQKSEYLQRVLEQGRVRAIQKAEETMSLVRQAMRIDYFS